MKNIALGQFYPADSILHRLDPRAKVILAILYIVCSFLCKNILSFALLLLSAIILIALSKIPFKIVLGSIKPIIFIMLFTFVLNLFWTAGEGEPIVSFWVINIYLNGLYNGLFMVLRIVSLIIGSCIFLTYTTTPIQLTDAIERLLSPLKVIKVPVHDFAMMMSIALRFIPTLVEETDKIMAAQKARGADFTSGSIVRRAKALIPILIPLFSSSIRRADELAVAMECRCYHGGKGRTKMTVLHYSFKDFLAITVLILLGVALVCLNLLEIGYTM